jgi:hypothetical protein
MSAVSPSIFSCVRNLTAALDCVIASVRVIVSRCSGDRGLCLIVFTRSLCAYYMFNKLVFDHYVYYFCYDGLRLQLCNLTEQSHRKHVVAICAEDVYSSTNVVHGASHR